MRHIKFDASGYIGYRNFTGFFFFVGFLLYEQDILDQIIISIIVHCNWFWSNVFPMTIISCQDSIPQCDFKFPEICDVIEKSISYGQDTFLLHIPQ